MSENFRKPEAYKSLNASSTDQNLDLESSESSENDYSILDKSVMLSDFIQSFKNLFTFS
jgi:hypothetical protein